MSTEDAPPDPAQRDAEDEDEDEDDAESARLIYEMLRKAILSEPRCDDPAVTLTALAHLLVDVARCAEIPPPQVITNVTKLLGGRVVSMPLAIGRAERGQA